MSWVDLYRTMDFMRSGRFVADRLLHLHLFGEPMMHPLFLDMAAEIKKVAPRISFSTNGVLIDFGLAERIRKVGFEYVTVSPHDMRKASSAYYILKSVGVDVVLHRGPDHNWAGQVPGEIKWRMLCQFSDQNMAVIRWNGDVAACCVTDGPEGVIGSIWDDDIDRKKTGVFGLCATCHLERSDKNGDDREAVPTIRHGGLPLEYDKMYGV